jgi:hypothetical protein
LNLNKFVQACSRAWVLGWKRQFAASSIDAMAEMMGMLMGAALLFVCAFAGRAAAPIAYWLQGAKSVVRCIVASVVYA